MDTNSTTQVTQPKKRNAVKSFMWKLTAVIVLVLCVMVYWFYYNVYSDGERTGLLTKLSHKGNIFKTYEGEMMIGNITATATGLANEKFFFSVADQKIADTLMKLQGQRVSLTYKQYRKTLFWRGESEYLITGYARVGN
jgi:hypothetical protein